MLNIPEEVKQLFRQSSIRKNIRIHFPNGEREDITNSNLIADSFSFTESICSQDTLKFGLCEASMVEFETFDVGNIKGFTIEVSHEIDISSLSEDFISKYGITSDDVSFPYYRIPYGVFVVDSCKKQANLKRRQVVAYTSEINWDDIPNPVERAKWDGTLAVAENLPYEINVPALVYSNVPNVNIEHFKDFIFMDLKDNSMTVTIGSFPDISTYELYVKIYYKVSFVPIDEKEDLFYLDYDIAENIKNIEDEINRLLQEEGMSQFFQEETKGNTKKIIQFLKYGWVDFVNTVPNGVRIPLNGFRYVYPYLDNSDSAYGKYLSIYIPYKADVVYDTTSGNITPDGEPDITIISKKTFLIRNPENIKIKGIKNLPQTYLSLNRTKTKINGETAYILNKDKIQLRSLIESYLELNGLFARNERNGNIELFFLKSMLGLYPSEVLYPRDDLLPRGNKQLLTKSTYNNPVWYDDNYTLLYSKVVCTYKNSETEEDTLAEYNIIEVVEGEESNYQTYDLSDNYLIQSNTFTEEEISAILEKFALNVEDIRYMPADINLIGLPYLEAGDVVQVLTTDGGFETIILNRTLSGIQRLNDNYESRR